MTDNELKAHEGLRAAAPEFVKITDDFAFGEAPEAAALDGRTRCLASLAALIGCGGIDEYEALLPSAADELKKEEIFETVYQSAAYLGIGRVRPFVAATAKTLGNDEPGRSVTTKKDRTEKGEQAQVDIFGEGMRGFASKGTMNRFLSANCFGDYYTRKGLPYSDRELITFCFLAAQGGCEPQLKSHAAANIRVGNGADKLTAVVLAVLPFIGYPRSLNALSCVAAAASGA